MIDTLLLDCEQAESGIPLMIRRPDVGPRIAVVDLYELERCALGSYRALLISMHADQRYLATRRAQIEAFLAGGGAVIAGGHVAHPFLPGLERFEPIPDYRLADLVVRRETEHPVWSGVALEDLNFRHGVAGFYGRGSHAPPPDATVIHTLGPQRLPLDFVYRAGSRGRVLFHGGNDLWTYLGMGNSAEFMIPQLFRWIAEGAL